MKCFDQLAKLQEVADMLDGLRLERSEFIKSQLRLRGTSLAEVGRSLEVGSGTMTVVSKGKGVSERVMLRLAEILEMDPGELWPERFRKASNGGPKMN